MFALLVMLVMGGWDSDPLCVHVAKKSIIISKFTKKWNMMWLTPATTNKKMKKKKRDANSVINNKWSTIWNVVYHLDHIFMFQLSNAAEAIMIITIAQNLSDAKNIANGFLSLRFFFVVVSIQFSVIVPLGSGELSQMNLFCNVLTGVLHFACGWHVCVWVPVYRSGIINISAATTWSSIHHNIFVQTSLTQSSFHAGAHQYILQLVGWMNGWMHAMQSQSLYLAHFS